MPQGSTYKRYASPEECAKAHPTYKDVDFVNRHPEVQCLWVGGAGCYVLLLAGHYISS